VQIYRIACGTSAPSLLKAVGLGLFCQPLHPPESSALHHLSPLATACIDGIWAAGGGCSVRSLANSRGCCPIEMCARAIVGHVAKDLNDDVAQMIQQRLQQHNRQQQHSGCAAWNQALPSLDALVNAAATSSSILAEVWLQHEQVFMKHVPHMMHSFPHRTQIIIEACACWCLWATTCLIPSTDATSALFSSAPPFINKAAAARLQRWAFYMPLIQYFYRLNEFANWSRSISATTDIVQWHQASVASVTQARLQFQGKQLSASSMLALPPMFDQCTYAILTVLSFVTSSAVMVASSEAAAATRAASVPQRRVIDEFDLDSSSPPRPAHQSRQNHEPFRLEIISPSALVLHRSQQVRPRAHVAFIQCFP
jgi:hypothetical protein